MSHTPGPWYWSAGTSLRGDKHQHPLGSTDLFIDEQILCIDLPEFISDENKRLIAAAPELLAACKAAIGPVGDFLQGNLELYDQLESAIAKAEGRI